MEINRIRIQYSNWLICLGPWYMLIAVKKKTWGLLNNTGEVFGTRMDPGSGYWIQKIIREKIGTQ